MREPSSGRADCSVELFDSDNPFPRVGEIDQADSFPRVGFGEVEKHSNIALYLKRAQSAGCDVKADVGDECVLDLVGQ